MIEKRRFNSEWGKMVLKNNLVPVKRAAVMDIPRVSHGSSGVNIEDPSMIEVKSTKRLRELGYILVHEPGVGTDGGRQNQYLIGDPDDPWARENVVANMPDFIRLFYKGIGNDEVIFYFWQRSMSGEWEELPLDSGPRKLNMDSR